MKSKIKKLDGTTRQFEIEMSKEKVKEVFDQVLEEIRKDAKIPGFRPGKAPLDIVRKSYHKDAMDEVKRRLIPKAYQEALGEHKVSPVSYPEISEVNISLSGDLIFKAKVDTHPEVNIRKYKGLKVTTQKVSVREEEIDEALMRIRNMYAEFFQTDRPLQKGDFGICDVETSLNGEIIAKKREDMWIEVDKEVSLLGMGEELCGLKSGDKKDTEAVLPEDYPDKKYAGKKATFHIEVKQTKEKKLPELDEKFVEKFGKKNLNEVREDLKSQLLERKMSNTKGAMKNQIIEQLLRSHSPFLPESMVNRQLKVLTEKAENELAEKGVASETIEANKEKLKERLLKEAKDKVKLYFLLDEIANRENINVSGEEVDNWLKTLADSYKQSFDSVKKYYEEHNLLGGLEESIREEKTLDLLLEEAVITEEK